MSTAFKQVIKNIKELSAGERALAAHCLLLTLESSQDMDVDEAWAEIAEKRLLELQSGAVDGVSWQSIKNTVMET